MVNDKTWTMSICGDVTLYKLSTEDNAKCVLLSSFYGSYYIYIYFTPHVSHSLLHSTTSIYYIYWERKSIQTPEKQQTVNR